MKFYLCHTPEGRKRLLTRQDEAKKLDPNCEPIDIPVDQAGIKAAFEELFDQIYDLEQQQATGVAETPDPSWPPPNCEGHDVKDYRDPGDELVEEDASKLDPHRLEEQVIALAEAGADGLLIVTNALDRMGVSPQFSRGVHLLSIIAADEHMMANLFLRERRKKQRRYA